MDIDLKMQFDLIKNAVKDRKYKYLDFRQLENNSYDI